MKKPNKKAVKKKKKVTEWEKFERKVTRLLMNAYKQLNDE